MSHISRVLAELKKLKLVECLTPDLRKGKQYTVTELGKKILKMIK